METRTYERGDGRTMTYRLLKSLVLFLSWISLGMWNEIVGPSINDLRRIVQANYEEISRVFSVRSGGKLVGSLFGGYLHERYRKQSDALLFVAMVMAGIGIITAPYCKVLWLMGSTFFLQGLGHGVLTTGGDPALIVLWADLAAGPLMFLHSGYGVGAAISPFLVTPFLSRNKTVTDNSSSSVVEISSQNYTPHLLNPATDEYIMSSNHSVNLVPGNTSVNGSSPKYVLTPTRIQIPYMIIGVVCFVIAISYLIFQVVKTPRLFRNDLTRSDSKDRTVKKLISPESCTGGNRAFGVQILLLTFFFYLVLISVERAYGKFLYPYARNSKLKFNRSDAALLTGVYWISFTVSRMVAFIVAKWLPVHIMMFIEITGMLACVILLNVFNDNRVAFWVLSTCFGFFKSPLYPTGLGWLNRYMEVTSMVILVVNIGGATGGIFGQWLTGYLFQHYGPQSFLYTILVWTILVAVFFSIMHFIAHRHGDRFSNNLNKINTDDTTHPEGTKAINNAHIPAKTYSSINNDSQRF